MIASRSTDSAQAADLDVDSLRSRHHPYIMTVRIEVDAQEYYRSKRFRCPSCTTVSTVSADAKVVRGSDFLFDLCEPCGMTIVIDNSDATLARGKVGFMAFPSQVEALMAVG